MATERDGYGKRDFPSRGNFAVQANKWSWYRYRRYRRLGGGGCSVVLFGRISGRVRSSVVPALCVWQLGIFGANGSPGPVELLAAGPGGFRLGVESWNDGFGR